MPADASRSPSTSLNTGPRCHWGRRLLVVASTLGKDVGVTGDGSPSSSSSSRSGCTTQIFSNRLEAFQQFQSPSHPEKNSTRPKQLFVVLHLIGIVGPFTAVRKVHDHASHVIAAVPAMTNPWWVTKW
jgi:hypothetical protein